MNYQNFESKFINNVYLPYMSGEFGPARQQLRALYKDGKNNPRAFLMQTAGSLNKIKKIQRTEIEKLKLENKNAEINESINKFVNFIGEIKAPWHPYLKQAKTDLANALNEIYITPKNQKFSKFILAKQSLPFLGKMKFLARFF